jgi:7-cyano-7-deazaguanine synthase
MNNKSAIVLLSGGLDSAATLYHAKGQGYKICALSFDYGQRHKKELGFARKLSYINKVRISILKIKFPWKGSSLLDKDIVLPKGRIGRKEIPDTYVPARNIVFLSFAASYAEAIGASKIFIGANQIDYSNYPDCRKDFLHAFNMMITKGTREGVSGKAISIEAPLIGLEKKDIIKKAFKMGVPFRYTWSCYMGGKSPCNKCDSCIIRKKGFKEAGIKDPLIVK